MNRFDIVMLVIGGRGELEERHVRNAADKYRDLRALNPDAVVGLSLSGYDDDPREIYEIPEARDYVKRFAALAGIRTPDDVPKQSGRETYMMALLAACGVFGDVETIKDAHGTTVRFR